MITWVSISGVLVCLVIVLQIELAFAFSWKNVSTNIISCEHDDVQLIWEYELEPGEYVKAKTWFTGEKTTAKRIAYWKDTDGLIIERAYTDRVTMTGNDSLILKDVTISDEGMYTFITNFPLSSEPDPRLSLNLTIYIAPLTGECSCIPDINASHDELRAFLRYELGCGKPSPILTWNVTRDKTVKNDQLILGDNDKGGMYKVCLVGPAVDRCFKGDNETLCKSYIVLTERLSQMIEEKNSFRMVTWIGISVVFIFLIWILASMALFFYKRLQKVRKEAEFKFHQTEGQTMLICTQNEDTDCHQTSKSTQEPNIAINIYRNISKKMNSF